MSIKRLIFYTEPSLKKQKVYLITLDKKEEFAYKINEGAYDMAMMAGLIYIWEAPVVREVEEQKKVINQAVNSGADLIMLVAMDSVRISDAVEEAKAKGVKIIYVDAPAVEEAIVTLATDNYNAGQIAGEIMIKELESEGIFSGSIGIIGVTQEIVTTMNREYGFRDAISEDQKYELLETKYAQGNPILSEDAVSAYMNDNPDLVGLFATNEGSTEGMGYALQYYNRPIIGIGFDMTDIIRDLLDENVIKATLVQNPYTMGYLGMAEAIAALIGKETGPRYINTGTSVITKYVREE